MVMLLEKAGEDGSMTAESPPCFHAPGAARTSAAAAHLSILRALAEHAGVYRLAEQLVDRLSVRHSAFGDTSQATLPVPQPLCRRRVDRVWPGAVRQGEVNEARPVVAPSLE
ncbi:MAG: hypothetical protein H0W48_16530 [Methylibium sp.]|nr:hypothetical protein [Methylibium sp.]